VYRKPFIGGFILFAVTIKGYFDIFDVVVALTEYTNPLRFVNETSVVGVKKILNLREKFSLKNEWNF
jgi:hypothetical protein